MTRLIAAIGGILGGAAVAYIALVIGTRRLDTLARGLTK